jgi:hypothetical protein
MDSQHSTHEASFGQERDDPYERFFLFPTLTGPVTVCRQPRVLLNFRAQVPGPYGFSAHVWRFRHQLRGGCIGGQRPSPRGPAIEDRA